MNLQYQYLIDLSTSISMFVVILVFLMLFEPRCSKKAYIISLAVFMVLWLGGNFYILLVYGIEVQGKYTLFTATLPSLIYFLSISKNRGGRFFFTFCLVDTVMIWMMMITGLIDYAAGSEGLVNFCLRMAAFPLMLLAAWRIVRKPYLSLLHTVSRGWWLFAGMTGIFYITLTIMSSIPTNLRLRPEDMPAAVMMLILLPLTYATIFAVLRQQDDLFRIRERQNILEAQAAMMERRAYEVRHAEEQLAIERHDLRHRLQSVAALVRQDDKAAVLEYIGASQEALNKTCRRRFCRNVILDAILSSFFDRAQEQEITMESRLVIPDTLPVDATELSTVFANALENAIHACGKLPPEERRIVCTCIAEPRFMFEISNPYSGTVKFGPGGLPVSERSGHGIGVRSILAFAEKHNAVCRFYTENGWFKMQLAL